MLAGLLAFCFGAAVPLFAAPRPVILPDAPAAEAMKQVSRLDAWRVVMHSDGIELRDYLNRPISRAKLQKEIRQGGQQVAREAARLSKVPGLGVLLAYLEELDIFASALRTGGAGKASSRSMSALLPSQAPKVKAPQACLVGAAPEGPSSPILSSLTYTTTPGRVRVQVLLL